MILKVTSREDGVWSFISEDRKIFFRRVPTAAEQVAMPSSGVFHGIFHLENGKSLFIETTKSRDW